MAEDTAQEKLNQAILYALRAGCFFPVRQPQRIDNAYGKHGWVQWGAMKHLHEAMAEFFRSRC